MSLKNALPLSMFPGNPWSATWPNQAQELITQYDLAELNLIGQDPGPDIAWIKRGVHVSVGSGVVKVFKAVPQSQDFAPFKKGNRHYNTLDLIATVIKVAPFDLNYVWPMIWDNIGNGFRLTNNAADDEPTKLIGVPDLAGRYVVGGKAYGAQALSSLFYSGLYSTALGLTTPTALTYPQPNNPNGIALFTDGTGGSAAETSAGAYHYANPTLASSGRFKNVWFGYGPFATSFGNSLSLMTRKPHATLSNVTSGARVTDVIGPTHMRDKFWRMMVQTLSPQIFAAGGALAAAATTNPYSAAVSALAAQGITEENFIGSGFGTKRFWIAPQLDNHPYVLAHQSDGADGGPADFWINISASTPGNERAAWGNLACMNADMVPRVLFYGAGDPQAQKDRECRFEGDLDLGAAAGDPGEVDMFGEVA